MKASELRLGNWVHQGDNFAMYVVGIFEDEVYIDFLGNEVGIWQCKIEDLHPVELNEEWLKEFGFEKRENSTMWHKGNFTYWKNQNMWYWRMEPIYPDFTKYVHQLQNLYNALTGEEL